MKRSSALAREIVHLLAQDQVDGGPLAPEIRQALREELSRCPHDPQDGLTEAARHMLELRQVEEIAASLRPPEERGVILGAAAGGAGSQVGSPGPLSRYYGRRRPAQPR